MIHSLLQGEFFAMNLEIKGKDNVPKLGPSEQAFFL